MFQSRFIGATKILTHLLIVLMFFSTPTWICEHLCDLLLEPYSLPRKQYLSTTQQPRWDVVFGVSEELTSTLFRGVMRRSIRCGIVPQLVVMSSAGRPSLLSVKHLKRCE